MSWPALRWAWDQPARGVQQHVLLALANRHNKESGLCNPSMADLASMTGLSERTIRRAIGDLITDGLVEIGNPGVDGKAKGGRRIHTRYVLLMDPERRSQCPPLEPETRPERPAKASETRPNLHAKADTQSTPVLRTRTRTNEPGTTPAAAASADEQAELFGVDAPAPVKAGRSLVVAERKELAQANAGHAVAAWCDAYAETHDAKPTARLIGQVGRESRQLFEAGNPPERVVHAARLAGARGLATVEKEYNALAKRRDVAQPPAHATAPRPSTTDARVNAGLALAAKYAQQEAG